MSTRDRRSVVKNVKTEMMACMSRRHTSEARKRGGLHCLKEDEIWTEVEEVWKNLPNSKIVRMYFLES